MRFRRYAGAAAAAAMVLSGLSLSAAVAAVPASAGTPKAPAAHAAKAPTGMNPLGTQRHSTRSGSAGPASRRANQPDLSSLGPPLPLGKLALGTYVTTQFKAQGIVFSGQSPFITNDGSSDINPTISGSPLFQGTVIGSFVIPGTTTATTVNAFALSVGYIDSPGSTVMTVLGADGQQLGVLTANQYGFNELVSTFQGAAEFIVSSVANEPAGWEINSIQVGAAQTNYVALGDSYSSGEGTYNFPYSQASGDSCDRGPGAWPVQMAVEVNANSPTGANLQIGPSTLIACQGAKMTTLSQPINGESQSELSQLSQYTQQSGAPSLVTVTIGGNDLGFANVLSWCYAVGTPACIPKADAFIQKVTTGAPDLIAQLAQTYEAISTASGSADVVAVGYPQIFPSPGSFFDGIGWDFHCVWLDFDANGLFHRFQVAAQALDADIEAAAAQAGVGFASSLTSLKGHELCTGDSWMNALSVFSSGLINDNRSAGHPTPTGQQHMATTIAQALGYDPPAGASMAAPMVLPTRAGHAQPRRAAPILRADGPLTIATSSLSGALTNLVYTDYLTASGGTPTYRWSVTGGSLPAGLSLDPNTGTISGIPHSTGTSQFTVQVTDSSSPTPQSATAQFSITVGAPSPLSVATTTLPGGTTGQIYAGSLSTAGGLGAGTWSVTGGSLPAGLTLNRSTGLISGKPTTGGTSTFIVQAKDQEKVPQVATAQLSITVVASSDPLAVATSTLPDVNQGTDYAVNLLSTGGVAPTTWSVTSGSLPPGLTLDTGTGQISGTAAGSGTYPFTVQVSDGTAPVSQTATADLSITVDPGPALALTASTLLAGTQGAPYSSTLGVNGGVLPYSWTVTRGGLPPGLSLDPSSGAISGTPSGSGTYTFGATVSDSSAPSAQTATGTYSITIDPSQLSVNQTVPDAYVGQYYATNVVPAGGSAPYSWQLTAGTLPDGLSFDPYTGAFVGTPTQSGSFPVSIQVTDSTSPTPQSVTVDLTLSVEPNPALAITSASLPDPSAGDPYTTAIGFNGGVGPYTWSVTSGSLPNGISLDPSSGMLTGTATTPGSSTFTVQVTDSSSPAQVATASETLTVDAPAALAITTTSLPDAAQGDQYGAGLLATGGTVPYTWSVQSGNLPPGLYLNSDGTIDGVPTSSGTFTAVVQVTDSSSPTAQTATAQLTLTVDAPPPLKITSTSLPNATQQSYYDVILDAGGGVSPYTWSLSSGRLPAGLTLASYGELYGTPTSYGDFPLTLTATDSSSPTPETATARVTVVVEPVPPAPPSWTQDSPPSPVSVGSGYYYQFAASGTPSPTYRVTSGHLPAGLSLNFRSGVLSGTATKGGTYTFTVTTSNGRTPDAVSPSISITVIPPPTITAISPLQGPVGTPVTITGTHLNGAQWVYFYGAYTYSFVHDYAGKLVVDVPSGAQTGTITVGTLGGQATSTQTFTVTT